MAKNRHDDIPTLSEKAILKASTVLERRMGRPRGSNKTQVNLRLDNDVLEWLKSNGLGYQTRLNEMLRKIMELSPNRLRRFSGRVNSTS